MVDGGFEKGFVARMTLEKVADGTQIIVYDDISPGTFRSTKPETEVLVALLEQKTRAKYPDMIISFTVVEVIKHDGAFYIKN